ncbi:MAG: amino acid permease [Phycisphaerae bacterium]|jgi:amino acid transporter/mannitol/fructose-specific phosphotransferase system IIA component (Ntr-type)|nr:amino acid permease [Phycisphaerae bacterium]
MSLKRKLGFWSVFCIASGAMISSGLFILPGQAFQISGPAIILAYALAALMVIPALLSKAELATAMPKSGGSYFFIERSMGALPGTLAGLAGWFSLALKSAFAMIGIGAFAQLIFPQSDLSQDQWEWLVKGVAIACCLIFMILNILSVKVAGRLQIAMVAGLLTVLAIFVIMGIGNVQQHPNYDDFLSAGFGNVFATSALVFVSFGGLTKVASVAEEIHDPGRNIPRAMLMACAVVSLFYIATLFVLVGTVDGDQLRAGPYGDMTPLSTAAGSFLGRFGVVILSGAAILAFVTTGNSGILAASRNPMAMSHDRFLPRSFGKISRRFGTPHISIIVTAVFMMSMIAFLSISDLIKVASTMKLVLFLLVNLAVLIMRGSRLQNYRPLYRSPLFPWIQLAGVGLYASLITVLAAKLGPVPILTAGGFLLAGVFWYVVYVRPRTTRKSALVHTVRRLVAKEMSHNRLETELREIAIERDQIVHDRFDRLVKDSKILDLPDGTTSKELFAKAADVLAVRLDMDRDTLLEKFHAREAQSTTVIQPGLAIPHIVVEGEGLFDLLVVRCREGAIFGPGLPPIQAAFVLIGSDDQRNYHLRALMAIAHIVQEHDFMDNWLAAPQTEHLRDMLLLSSRQRDTEDL